MRKTLLTVFSIALAVAPKVMLAKEDPTDRLDAASDLLTNMMRADDKGIPQDLMNRAQCVVLVPGLKKAGFIVGAKYGRGFAMCRKATGSGWSAPAGIRIEGGSVGFQIGGSEQDVLLLVMSQSGMKHLLSDKFTIGGEASAAAGPLGREATAQTDAAMHAEMLSYSRSRGLFAGIALQGATLRPDDEADAAMYGTGVKNREILMGGAVKAPPAAMKLEGLLNSNSSRMSH